MGKIKTICKLPGRAPYATHISNNLGSLQSLLGGYIETITFSKDCVLIVNEEGRINGMPYNCTYCGLDLYGPVYFVGTDGEEFADFPTSFEDFKACNSNLWEVE